MMYCIWILFICSFVRGDDLQTQSTFKQAVCSQDQYTFNITCEDIKSTNETQFKSSKWPPGPYAIPMSIYGCPESHLHDWTEGYISLIWRQRSRIFIKQMLRRKENIEYLHKLSSSNWPFTETSIYGPSSDSYLKLTFCYKQSRNSSLPTLEWPKKNYSIYAVDNSCPSGFDLVQTNVTLPPVEAWTTDGNVPSFALQNMSDFAILHLYLCSMTGDAENSTSDDASMPKGTTFVLLKNPDSVCPLVGDNVLEESLLVDRENEEWSNADNYSHLESIQQYCVYSDPASVQEQTVKILTVVSCIADIFGLYSRGSINDSYRVPVAESITGNRSVYLQGAVQTVDAKQRKDYTLTMIANTYTSAKTFIWKLLNFGRTVSMVGLDIYRTDGGKIRTNEERLDFYRCFYGRDKWSFLYFGALLCPFEHSFIANNTVLRFLFTSTIEGKYVALVFTTASTFVLHDTSIDLYTRRTSYYGGDSCNMDFGMTDGAIEDSQISASSWHPGFPPNASRPFYQGWCADPEDEKPHITVDLREVTKVEGITLWNWKETFTIKDHAAEGDKSYLLGVDQLAVSYKNQESEWQRYNTDFYFDKSRVFDEPQSLWFMKPFTSRYVRLHIIKPVTDGLSCMRFELQGCRIIGNQNIVPTMYRKSAQIAAVSFMQSVERDTLISTIRYPSIYDSGTDYLWVVKYQDNKYIKLIFVHISLREPKATASVSQCNDSIIISKELAVERDSYRVLDYQYNGMSPILETSESFLVITFTSCLLTSKKQMEKVGFKAIISNQDIPACFRIDSPMDLHIGRRELCLKSSMSLSPMSFLGIPFLHTTEEWKIHSPRKRIQLNITAFQVGCKIQGVGSEFKIIDHVYEREYCNLRRPPNVTKSHSDTVVIVFKREEDQPHIVYTTGFRIIYSILENVEGKLISYMSPRAKLKNIAIGKPVEVSSAFTGLYAEKHSKTKANDGIIMEKVIIPDMCFITNNVHNPWVMIDLEDVFNLDVVVVYQRNDPNFYDAGKTPARFPSEVKIWTGFYASNLSMTGYICKVLGWSTAISQRSVVARYVKIQLMSHANFPFCEVELYGSQDDDGDVQPEMDIGIMSSDYLKAFVDFGDALGGSSMCTALNLQEADAEYGEWSTWGNCSAVCGPGTRKRTRRCTKPSQIRCRGNDFEIEKCIGTDSCPVCSNKFKKCYHVFSQLTNWKHAGTECWSRKLNLVSISSTEELRFIKYLLRETILGYNLQIPQAESRPFNASFYSHIGISRVIMANNMPRYIWENGSPVIVNAWKEGEPSTGNCCRMNYQLFQPDETWESEDCVTAVADSFVCEQYLEENEKPAEYSSKSAKLSSVSNDWTEVYDLASPKGYAGKVNVTADGAPCLPWTAITIDEDTEFVDGSKAAAVNYCRDPMDSGYLWCYVERGWSKCNVELSAGEPLFPYIKYTGSHDKTFTGKTCQRWDIKSTRNGDFPGEKMSNAANYCRDPWNNGYLWCYTSDVNTAWEPCVFGSPSGRCPNILNKYSGTKNTTFSGKTCLSWKSVSKQWVKRGYHTYAPPHAENYCRDPYDDGYNWCYYGDNEDDREPCLVDVITDSTYVSSGTLHTRDNKTFSCGNGDVIKYINKCDNKFDCSDLSDETDCWQNISFVNQTDSNDTMASIFPVGFEKSSYMQCGTLEWVSIIAVCDGIKDCLDASDELHCFRRGVDDGGKCKPDEFLCGDGDCVHISQVCNFVVDCVDISDEYCDFDSCDQNEHRCENGQCILETEWCDGLIHCVDGSDEGNCGFCNQDKAFHCDGTKCISKQLVCDTFKDCLDGSDELYCHPLTFLSCQEWWEAGYQQSGSYIIRDIQAWCDFDSIISKGTIYTIIQNIDLFWKQGTGFIYTRPTQEIWDFYLNAVVESNRTYHQCKQQFEQTCSPVQAAVWQNYNISTKRKKELCSCTTLTVNIDGNCKFDNENRCWHTEACDGTLYRKRLMSDTDLQFSYSVIPKNVNRKLELLKSYTSNTQIIPGPITCTTKQAYKEEVACENEAKLFPKEIRCVYNLDASGIVIGCRSGSHLQNCENHQCSSDMMKCPGSYCIPKHFICDGQLQCPDGQDEKECGCQDAEREIVILVNEQFYTSFAHIVDRFARQFHSPGSTVRILKFNTRNPWQPWSLRLVHLQITDQVIQPIGVINRFEDCEFNIAAQLFVQAIRYSEAKIKGLVFIEGMKDDLKIANALFTNLTSAHRPDLNIYRLKEESNFSSSDQRRFQGVTDVVIPQWKVLSFIGAEFFPELCKGESKVSCISGYRCLSSRMCIPLSQVCDGQAQCGHGDDEQLCNFTCPQNCSCVGYAVNCRNRSISIDGARTMPKTTRALDLSLNKALNQVLQHYNLILPFLVRLNLSSCDIDTVSIVAFNRMKHLQSLDLSFNVIQVLYTNTFYMLKYLTNLFIQGNFQLSKIEPNAFNGLVNIRVLNLAGSELKIISSYTFTELNLESLDLSNNALEEIENFAFSELSVVSLNFENNDITKFNKDTFTGIRNLKTLITPAYKFCCVRPTYLPEDNCYPPKDEFSSCEDLMRLSALQTMLWLIGLSALIGNILSVVYRLFYDRERLKLGFGVFVTNLAIADFLMGVYLIMIAVADAVYRKRYIFFDEYWRHSSWCKIAGVLSTMSSEASVFYLCLITIDRILVIKYPFGQIRLSSKNAVLLAVLVWVFTLVIALLPVMYTDYFEDKFYSRSGVCIALPLTRDRPPGWIYSVTVFIGLNFITFLLIAFGQWSILFEVRKSSSKVTKQQSARNKDLKVARNLLLVVTTDFLCWFPIGVMGLMALNGHVISGDVYAWTAVFILPINSALNPVLYTLSAILGKQSINPDLQETQRVAIYQELGQNLLNVRRHLNKPPAKRGYQSLRKMLDSEHRISCIDSLVIVTKLTKCLDALHCCELTIGKMDIDSVFVKFSREKKNLSCRITKEPAASKTETDTARDMVLLGRIIGCLIENNTRTSSSRTATE